jgi:PAS domain S-box-containing protein
MPAFPVLPISSRTVVSCKPAVQMRESILFDDRTLIVSQIMLGMIHTGIFYFIGRNYAQIKGLIPLAFGFLTGTVARALYVMLYFLPLKFIEVGADALCLIATGLFYLSLRQHLSNRFVPRFIWAVIVAAIVVDIFCRALGARLLIVLIACEVTLTLIRGLAAVELFQHAAKNPVTRSFAVFMTAYAVYGMNQVIARSSLGKHFYPNLQVLPEMTVFLLLNVSFSFLLGIFFLTMTWNSIVRSTEAVLRESEKRFRIMADTAPSLIWMCDARGQVTYLNDCRIAFTGPNPDAGHGSTWMKYVHPDDLEDVLDALYKALRTQQPFSKEYRLRRADGAYRWMFDVASPRRNGDGSFVGLIGSALDITDQRLAQQALSKVSSQLVEAQEKERNRIARDLHDDICQRLALLSMELDQTSRVLYKSPTTINTRLREIRTHCSEIARAVQSLAHQLHSPELDCLGLAAAIRGFCKKLAAEHGATIEYRETNVPTYLPQDISLCLFRVTQEALQNAIKHSGGTRFAVELSTTSHEIRLIVSDSGTGFDVEEAKLNRGLGLVSMEERINVMHGRLFIESKPRRGTRIFAIVPLVAEKQKTMVDPKGGQFASFTR